MIEWAILDRELNMNQQQRTIKAQTWEIDCVSSWGRSRSAEHDEDKVLKPKVLKRGNLESLIKKMKVSSKDTDEYTSWWKRTSSKRVRVGEIREWQRLLHVWSLIVKTEEKDCRLREIERAIAEPNKWKANYWKRKKLNNDVAFGFDEGACEQGTKQRKHLGLERAKV